jgi:hypothetical protein
VVVGLLAGGHLPLDARSAASPAGLVTRVSGIA